MKFFIHSNQILVIIYFGEEFCKENIMEGQIDYKFNQ